MASRPSWRGHLKLSLVTCPVALHNAISPGGDVRFNLINPETGNRIKMITVDAGTEEPVERKNLVKGYEISKGEYVMVTPEEIESVKLESTRTIEIDSFVSAHEIDRLYWDHPYFLTPDGKMAAEPFAVIRTAMEHAGQVALGRVVISQRERLLALEPREDGIIATTLRSHDEVKSIKAAFADIPSVKADKDMIAIAEKIISQKETPFDPETFVDRYEDALRDLIAEKQKGHEIVHPEALDEASNVVDLMAALRASLKGGGGTAAKSSSKSSSGKAAGKSASKASSAGKSSGAKKPAAKKAKKRA
jgi:DNA end-binding protein Ku